MGTSEKVIETNEPITEAGRLLVREFEKIVPALIKDRGVSPLPVMAVNNKGILRADLELPDPQVIETFIELSKRSEVESAICCVDRWGDKDEQGTKLKSVLVCILYEKRQSRIIELGNLRFMRQLRYGVIEYRVNPRKVLPMNWKNRYWREKGQEGIGEVIAGIAGRNQRVM